MATMSRPKPTTRGARARGSDPEGTGADDAQYDLLTAALIGVVIGAGTALLLRRGPSGRRPLGPAVDATVQGVRSIGRRRRKHFWERIPPVDEIRGEIGDVISAAREAVADTVEHELRDLRKSIRRQRRKLGV